MILFTEESHCITLCMEHGRETALYTSGDSNLRGGIKFSSEQ